MLSAPISFHALSHTLKLMKLALLKTSSLVSHFKWVLSQHGSNEETAHGSVLKGFFFFFFNLKSHSVGRIKGGSSSFSFWKRGDIDDYVTYITIV